MARPQITAKSDFLFRKQLDAALDYVEGIAGSGTDPEIVRDTMATALVAGTNITITVSDPGDTITIDASGGGGGGGGTTITSGTATLSFGAAPGTNIIELAVTGQAGIGTGSVIKAWFAADSTTDHNAYEHGIIFPSRVGLACGNIVAGAGFTIYASTELRLTGDVTCRWEWY